MSDDTAKTTDTAAPDHDAHEDAPESGPKRHHRIDRLGITTVEVAATEALFTFLPRPGLRPSPPPKKRR